MLAWRMVAFLAALGVCACASTSKRSAPEPLPPYSVGGAIGLVVTPEVLSLSVRMPDEEAVASLEARAEATRKEAQKGVGVTAFTILVAPLAILFPLYPPAIRLAAFPFMAANETANLSQQVDMLNKQAAQARRDAACARELAAAHPGVAEAFKHGFADDALRRAIETDVREALATRSRLPVTLVSAHGDAPSDDPVALVKRAKEAALPTLVHLDVASLDVAAEAIGDDGKTCRYTVAAAAEITWWDAENHVLVYRNDAFGGAKLPIGAFDLPALLDRPDELRLRVARGFRDAVAPTFDVPQLKFAVGQP